ncbi:MAG: hypothetical protein A2Y10_18580 [Planctomycetes bacterium GWF2_41_51]|nr:MAG: hypothetical protein A2Y10_18580 [Planctomycetes bacterium GWF2_41_51]HBG27146.1 hypothetical protein [Phycisphaerales bacterium]
MNKINCFLVILCGIAVRFSFAAIAISQWQELHPGIYHATGRADAYEVRLQKVNVLKIDLDNPEISFFTTPSNGALPLETVSQTTGNFLQQYELQAAINANYFSPCCSSSVENKNLDGLAISDFHLISYNIPNGNIKGTAVMLISADNIVTFLDYSQVSSLVGIKNAVAGGPILLGDNVILVDTGGDPEPRTAVGTSVEGRYLFFIAIDGRQDGYSEGATYYETAQWLQRFGAANGINFDGGGSTTMIKAAENGSAVILNHPPNGTQRLVGNNIGVYAYSEPVAFIPRTLIAYKGFDYPFSQWGIDSNPVPPNGGLDGLNGGFGWRSAWHDDLENATRLTGIAVFPGSESGPKIEPLSFSDSSGRKLLTNGNQLRTSAGPTSKCVRYIDTRYAPQNYITNGQFGTDNKNIWLSFLAQSAACIGGDRWAYVQLDESLRLGKIAQKSNWAVWADGNVAESAICTDQVVMYLAKIEFGSLQDTVKVWLNPPLSKESDLGTPDMVITIDDLHFLRVEIFGRYSTDFDELRLGTCFEAVTINDPKADLSRNGYVNMADFSILADFWNQQMTFADITGPDNYPDGKIDFYDLYEISLLWLYCD